MMLERNASQVATQTQDGTALQIVLYQDKSTPSVQLQNGTVHYLLLHNAAPAPAHAIALLLHIDCACERSLHACTSDLYMPLHMSKTQSNKLLQHTIALHGAGKSPPLRFSTLQNLEIPRRTNSILNMLLTSLQQGLQSLVQIQTSIRLSKTDTWLLICNKRCLMYREVQCHGVCSHQHTLQ
jgi:hypothetical protein